MEAKEITHLTHNRLAINILTGEVCGVHSYTMVCVWGSSAITEAVDRATWDALYACAYAVKPTPAEVAAAQKIRDRAAMPFAEFLATV